jgi:hypothetical protein
MGSHQKLIETSGGKSIHEMNLTINSNRLEDSVKAPGRPPIRIENLTQFLIEQHFSRIGVFTKSHNELFKFWKGYVSIVYREQKLRKSKTLHPMFQNDN